jgi:hypothetical protein
MNNADFTWTLKSTVTIVALGRTVNDLKLNKELKVAGTLTFVLLPS